MHTVVPTYRHITSTIKQNVSFLEGVVSSNTAHGEVYSMQHYANKFVSDMQQVGGFLWVLWFLPPIKLTTTI